jgi:transcriptional regulator with XRE-family HTH domain
VPEERWVIDARKRVGDRVRVRRIYKNLTQERLAELTGIDRSTIQRIEAGNDAKVGHLLRIARALDMLPRELLD